MSYAQCPATANGVPALAEGWMKTSHIPQPLLLVVTFLMKTQWATIKPLVNCYLSVCGKLDDWETCAVYQVQHPAGIIPYYFRSNFLVIFSDTRVMSIESNTCHIELNTWLFTGYLPPQARVSVRNQQCQVTDTNTFAQFWAVRHFTCTTLQLAGVGVKITRNTFALMFPNLHKILRKEIGILFLLCNMNRWPGWCNTPIN